MKKRLLWIFLALLTMVFPQTIQAEEEVVIKEQRGIKFKLPADWPVEERNGGVGPIPIEEYLSRKFSALNSRLDAIESRLGTTESGLRTTEQRMGTAEQRLASVEKKQMKTE